MKFQSPVMEAGPSGLRRSRKAAMNNPKRVNGAPWSWSNQQLVLKISPVGPTGKDFSDSLVEKADNRAWPMQKREIEPVGLVCTDVRIGGKKKPRRHRR